MAISYLKCNRVGLCERDGLSDHFISILVIAYIAIETELRLRTASPNSLHSLPLQIAAFSSLMLLFIAFLLALPSYRTNLDHPSWVKNLPSEADYLVPRRNRELSILYHGAQERLRVSVDKMIKGETPCTPCIHEAFTPDHTSHNPFLIRSAGEAWVCGRELHRRRWAAPESIRQGHLAVVSSPAHCTCSKDIQQSSHHHVQWSQWRLEV